MRIKVRKTCFWYKTRGRLWHGVERAKLSFPHVSAPLLRGVCLRELTLVHVCVCADCSILCPGLSLLSLVSRSLAPGPAHSPFLTLACPLPLRPCLCMCLRWEHLLPMLPTLLDSQRRPFLPPRMGSRCRRWEPVPVPLPCASLDLFSCQRDRTKSFQCQQLQPQPLRQQVSTSASFYTHSRKRADRLCSPLPSLLQASLPLLLLRLRLLGPVNRALRIPQVRACSLRLLRESMD